MPNRRLPHLNASMQPHMSRPSLVRSSSPKQEPDKRNGLDRDLLEESREECKRVRWNIPNDSLQDKRGPSKSKLSQKSPSFITPSSTKPMQFDPDTPKEVQVAHELRLAVHRGGGSTDPDHNYALRAKLSPLQLPYSRIQRILKECELYERNQTTFIVPIDYNDDQVALVCKARTHNLAELKQRLAPLLMRYKARLYNRHLFTETGVIKAIVPRKTRLNFSDFSQTVQTDALWCKASSGEISDYENGFVVFKCPPNELADVAAKLKQSGYKIHHSEIGHCPNEHLVSLSPRHLKRYVDFVMELKQDEDIFKVYDNVDHQI
ncbi:uncharacterized protein LOC108155315 [Drosophila miranda]|uniref:uncharacterized protein LOC108155315 n=1 Tax=Drosophila miranda TaxID=7229 RepID=UPI0007E846E6|nr:uncharacterized protein LOC108155315 [Drosophila miranda]